MPSNSSEIAILNFYRASQLHGGLILGQTVRRASDSRVILSLTRRSAEKMMHARLWTETIVAIGGVPAPVQGTYQTRYAETVGTPRTIGEVLALTQIVDRHAHRDLTSHLRMSGVHPAVVATLRRIVNDEAGGSSWIKSWLEEQPSERVHEIRDIMRRYALAAQRVHDSLCREYGLKPSHCTQHDARVYSASIPFDRATSASSPRDPTPSFTKMFER